MCMEEIDNLEYVSIQDSVYKIAVSQMNLILITCIQTNINLIIFVLFLYFNRFVSEMFNFQHYQLSTWHPSRK